MADKEIKTETLFQPLCLRTKFCGPTKILYRSVFNDQRWYFRVL